MAASVGRGGEVGGPVGSTFPRHSRCLGLVDREAERAVLYELTEAVRSGESRAVVLRGEAGVGKTALLDHLVEQATGCQVFRVTGMQSEMELAYAGLHLLCSPIQRYGIRLPPPQGKALEVAFGLSDGLVPDRFRVGLAVLGLLSEVAAERPLICVVDDYQWLDRASAEVLGFVARRLAADAVGLVFGTRVTGQDELAGIRQLVVGGLGEEHARTLLERTQTGPLDNRVRDQLIAESDGNPLALLELPRSLPHAQLAGGFGLPFPEPLADRIEESFARQLQTLPADSRSLLLVASADPAADQNLVWKVAECLGVPRLAGQAAVESGLMEIGARLRFRHPLLRSVTYRSAAPVDRRDVHRAFAEAVDPVEDADRRAWHLAQAAEGPDDQVAADLEASADRARARGGLAAAAAFLHRAALLTADSALRAERLLAAASANVQAGVFPTAHDCLAAAAAEPLDEMQLARVDLTRAQIVFASGQDGEAPQLLLDAAQQLQRLDPSLARDTFLSAWMAALFAEFPVGERWLSKVSQGARSMSPSPTTDGTRELVLDALSLLITDGPAAAAGRLRAIVEVFTADDLDPEDDLRFGWFAQAAASAVWDERAWLDMLRRQAQLGRETGILDHQPIVLSALGTASAWIGDFAAAATLATEQEVLCEATGVQIASFGAMCLAALRGDAASALPIITETVARFTEQRMGVAVVYAHWMAAVLYNGLGRYEEAQTAAECAAGPNPGPYVSTWALPELIEAAVRAGDIPAAERALAFLAASTQAGGTDFALGIEARCRALITVGAAAESFHVEAIDRLSRTLMRLECARARLLYGEWLRREGRRTDARAQLRLAYETLADIGAEAFAERARRELQATGEKARSRTADDVEILTDQEALIARLAAEGRTNPEIGMQLFISARTVEWHLRKVFGKLGVASRRELPAVLAPPGVASGV